MDQQLVTNSHAHVMEYLLSFPKETYELNVLLEVPYDTWAIIYCPNFRNNLKVCGWPTVERWRSSAPSWKRQRRNCGTWRTLSVVQPLQGLLLWLLQLPCPQFSIPDLRWSMPLAQCPAAWPTIAVNPATATRSLGLMSPTWSGRKGRFVMARFSFVVKLWVGGIVCMNILELGDALKCCHFINVEMQW